MRFTIAQVILTLASLSSAQAPLPGVYTVTNDLGTYLTANIDGIVTSNRTSTSPDLQYWILDEGPYGSILSSRFDGLSLTGTVPNEEVLTLPLLFTRNQGWKIEDVPSGGYRIQNEDLRGYLGVKGGNKTEGAEISVFNWIGNPYQIWHFKEVA